MATAGAAPLKKELTKPFPELTALFSATATHRAVENAAMY
jgi:hypothetical protein